MKFVREVKRSRYCGDLSAAHVGQEVVLMGWVDSRRDHGGLVFLDLRDREGLVQVVFNPAQPELESVKSVRGEYVLAVAGRVRARPQGMVNKKIETGEVEVEALRCEILSTAQTPPIQIGDEKVSEVLRLKYRYLDLRSQGLQKSLFLRHRTAQMVRNYLADNGFIEVETPILYKSTPEGARDYLVPSRVHPGYFFALPQSPQTLKQLLMIGGFDRYFQLAKCFRDEDLRADRQPEFSQIDIEMSFVDEDDLIALTEGLAKKLWLELKGVRLGDFPKMTYHEAMSRFGSDKPDLRIPWELKDLGSHVKGCGFKVFEDVLARGGSVKALAVPGLGSASRSRFDRLTATAKQMRAKGLIWIKNLESGDFESPVSKFFPGEGLSRLFEAGGGEKGGAVLIVADDFEVTCSALCALRLELAHELKAVESSRDYFLWVTDFPLLEYSPEDKRWVARHHPFTSPKDEDLEYLLTGEESKFAGLRAKAYDLVCNGYELAGGSIRIHRHEVQAAMFKALGLSPEETREKFGFFIEALQYGTPPHGGIAWGFDRLAMLLVGTDAIRDVIAFPKTAQAQDLMAEAPSRVTREQLIELGIRLAGAAEKNLERPVEHP